MHPGSRPPYFSTPGAPQTVEAPSMGRMGGPPYPPASQPFPLPTRHHPQQSVPHSAMLHSPQHRVGGGGSSHSSQALRHHAQQRHPGQQQQQHQQQQQQQQHEEPPQQHGQQGLRKPEGVCELCGTTAMFLCSTCRSVWYCSQRCQVKALSDPLSG